MIWAFPMIRRFSPLTKVYLVRGILYFFFQNWIPTSTVNKLLENLTCILSSNRFKFYFKLPQIISGHFRIKQPIQMYFSCGFSAFFQWSIIAQTDTFYVEIRNYFWHHFWHHRSGTNFKFFLLRDKSIGENTITSVSHSIRHKKIWRWMLCIVKGFLLNGRSEFQYHSSSQTVWQY